MTNERERMEQVYQERRRLSDRYVLSNPGNLFNFEYLHNAVGDFIGAVIPDPSEISLLDIGAGDLFWVDRLVKLGIRPSHAIGSDLLVWRLKEGISAGRNFSAVCCSAAQLPFVDGSFDLVTQFTMMTSILNQSIRTAAAQEMIRVLQPGGYILWYDFRVNNPGNPHTRAIGKSEIRELFPGLPVMLRSLTLLPPLARLLTGPLRPFLSFLHQFPMLRTHYIALIGPKGHDEDHRRSVL